VVAKIFGDEVGSEVSPKTVPLTSVEIIERKVGVRFALRRVEGRGVTRLWVAEPVTGRALGSVLSANCGGSKEIGGNMLFYSTGDGLEKLRTHRQDSGFSGQISGRSLRRSPPTGVYYTARVCICRGPIAFSYTKPT
jgi:hypothetical protein